MRLPTISFSRSRRSVSTSGSSGIAPPFGRHRLGRVDRRRAGRPAPVEALPRVAGGRLLGLLLGPALARAVRLAPEVDGGEEPLGVVGALVGYVVTRQLVEAPRRQLLEPGLV